MPSPHARGRPRLGDALAAVGELAAVVRRQERVERAAREGRRARRGPTLGRVRR
ncbi:hypothetical protein [Micromonospora sp. NPDC002717]|uniref:hypothetical protein n=1 Tax=Micromonospora sp. NPDC002717 TaxID=3154424 RepID=UPI00331B4B16